MWYSSDKNSKEFLDSDIQLSEKKGSFIEYPEEDENREELLRSYITTENSSNITNPW